MAISSANAAASPKTRRVVTLLSGTSWTVPAGVEYVNATLIGGGGGGQGTLNVDGSAANARPGNGGSIVSSTVSTTPGSSITYAIGAGGVGGDGGTTNNGGVGGDTTFTGATTAPGGSSSAGAGAAYLSAGNGGNSGFKGTAGASGGAGSIILEYFL